MGVHGLWRLIEPSGKPVALETLENKILAVDVSIWLHQAIKGFQDSKGAPVPNAHLLGIYHRICKLLYFRIKPVFVFDGGVPALKKQTIAKRNLSKSKNSSEAERLQKQLINTLLKHSAISKVLSEKTKAVLSLPAKKPTKHENMYALPSVDMDSTISSSSEEEVESTDTADSSPTKNWDIHTIDMTSTHFKSLPVDMRHEILTELKETRKRSSWGRLHELPKQSDDFALFQMKRLLKRQAVQSALEDAEQEMGGHSLSLAELESILKDHGVAVTNDIGKRIASDENTRYLYIKDVKQALEKARKVQEELGSIQEEDEASGETDTTVVARSKTKADLEFEEDLERAIALSLQEEPSTSKAEISGSSRSDVEKKLQFSFLENFNDGDFDSDTSEETEKTIRVSAKNKFSSAESYMLEYSGLTPSEISKILSNKTNSITSRSKDKDNVEEKVINSNSDRTTESCKVTSTEQNKMGNEAVKSSVILEIKNKSTVDQSSTSKFTDVEIEEIKDRPEIETNNETLSCDNFDPIKISSTTESQTTDNIEIISNSDTSGDEFEEIRNDSSPENKDSMEIIIDPCKKFEDDLFSDIFNNSDEIKEDLTEKLISATINDRIEKKVEEQVNNEEMGDEILIPEVKTSKNISANATTAVAESVAENKTELDNNNIANNAKEPEEISCKYESKLENMVEPEKEKLKLEEMANLQHELQKERIDILVEKSTKERMAANITDQMYQEAQDLLELFGVPYLIAPMEAEAQCAFLDAVEITDGTITDDSDIWLFGGRTVYKNFFNQSKYVMEFKAENINHHFKLTRQQMILLALLVGSDYTIGIQGVGPVTALEILATFPPMESKEFHLSQADLLSGLKEFRSWFNKGQSTGLGRSSLKNKLKNIKFTENFPSVQVVQAYLEPTVETSKEKFSWSKPDFVGLSDFAKEKFGWSAKKTEEILKPVIKKVEENQSQKSIKDYYKAVYKSDSSDIQNQMSKRVKSAIDRIGKAKEELISEEMEALTKEKQKKSRGKSSRKPKTDVEEKEVQSKPKLQRKKKCDSIPTKNGEPIATNECGEGFRIEEPIIKKSRTRSKKNTKNRQSETPLITPDESSAQTKTIDDNSDDIKRYEEIAADLKKRRQRRQESSKKDDSLKRNKKTGPKELPVVNIPTETIPDMLVEDEEIKLLRATTSRSMKRTEEIEREVKNEMEEVKKRRLPHLHQKEVIHQKLRDRSDVLRNKLKAIEVFRKSKKGPGYIPKRGKKKMVMKEDAELSENSSDD